MPGTVSRRAMLQGLMAAGVGSVTPWREGHWTTFGSVDATPPGRGGHSVYGRPGTRVPAASRRRCRASSRRATNSSPSSTTRVPPPIDPATYALRLTGLVDRPLSISLADLKKRPRVEQVVGFECSGNNSARGNPLVGNARWAGTSLAPLLKEGGLKPTAREIVFFSVDKGTEEITHGGAPETVEQHFARSLSIDDAMRPEVMLAYEMDAAPLPHPHGAPVRLIVPGWYGVANVKWLDHIHVQESRFMGRFMARDYVTLRGDDAGGETVWNETSVSRTRLKSAIGRLTRTGATLKATGFALTDGTPLKAVEVSVDERTVEARHARQAQHAVLLAAVHA